MPERIRLSRQRGWRKPEGCIVIRRPTKWGNPYKVVSGDAGCWQIETIVPHLIPRVLAYASKREATVSAVALFRLALVTGKLEVTVDDVRRELAGHDLGCTCSLDEPCHGDPLLTIANG